MVRKVKRVAWGLSIFVFIGLATLWFLGSDERARRRAEQEELERAQELSQQRSKIAEQMGSLFHQNEYPTHAELDLGDGEREKLNIEYTFIPELQNSAEKLLKSYRPDYAAIVVMDAVTGEIWALANYVKGQHPSNNIALQSTFPAASIFKIVTAAAAIDKANLSPDTLIMFNGADHTLYRRNVLFNKINRWTREISLKRAFARSINTVFGRLTLEHLSPQDLEEYAIRFGFNQPIHSDLPVNTGFTQVPDEKNFELAEIASGYNRVTTMSPIQGAMIAASVANLGVMRVPYVIRKLTNEDGEVKFQPQPVTAAVTLSGAGAESLKELMEETIVRGTSTKSFRPLVRDRRFRELELGGKTGSLMGRTPRGKVDWFVGYAIAGENQALAISAITINIDKWQVKSSYLAQSIFKQHFKEQFSSRNEKFFSAQSNGD